MVREHYVAVLPINHVSAFYMEPTTNTQFNVKCTYMIGREHSHMVLPDHVNLSRKGGAAPTSIEEGEVHIV